MQYHASNPSVVVYKLEFCSLRPGSHTLHFNGKKKKRGSSGSSLCLVTVSAVDQSHQQVSSRPSYAGKERAGAKSPWQWSLCAVPGASHVPSCTLSSNLPLTFMMMTFPNHFLTSFIWRDGQQQRHNSPTDEWRSCPGQYELCHA